LATGHPFNSAGSLSDTQENCILTMVFRVRHRRNFILLCVLHPPHHQKFLKSAASPSDTRENFTWGSGLVHVIEGVLGVKTRSCTEGGSMDCRPIPKSDSNGNIGRRIQSTTSLLILCHHPKGVQVPTSGLRKDGEKWQRRWLLRLCTYD
jgi:hypothetical protein